MFRLRNVTLRSRSVGVFVNPVVVGDTPAGRVVGGGVFACVVGSITHNAVRLLHNMVGWSLSTHPRPSTASGHDTRTAPFGMTHSLETTIAPSTTPRLSAIATATTPPYST